MEKKLEKNNEPFKKNWKTLILDNFGWPQSITCGINSVIYFKILILTDW